MSYTICIVYAIVSLQLSLGEYEHVIFVDSEKGSNSVDCLMSNNRTVSCLELNWVLQQPVARRNSTHLVLFEGSHTLWEPFSPFEDLVFLAISGSDSIIVCMPDISIAFTNVQNIFLSNITFKECASFINWPTLTDSSGGMFVGLFFYMCRNLSMDHVSVTNSPNATGMALFNTGGTNIFTVCEFSHNSVTGAGIGGGGGLMLWTQYEPMENASESCDTKYLITSCVFDSNIAKEFNQTHDFPDSIYRPGFGGGVAMVISGNTSSVWLIIDNSTFTNNSASAAGALFIEMSHGQGNMIRIKDTKFQRNFCPYSFNVGSSGGAIYIVKSAHLEYTPYVSEFVRNQWSMDNCTLENNRAIQGGAIAIAWPLETTANVTAFDSSHCLFLNNTAKFGSAMYLEHIWKNSRNEGLMAEVNIIDCEFKYNAEHIIFDDSDEPVNIGIGTVSIFSSVVYFYGNNTFKENSGTALALANSDVIFYTGYAIFLGNVGFHGGALALFHSSTVNLDSGTNIMFDSNMAMTRGGAMYVSFLSGQHKYCEKCCFVRHLKSHLTPDDWNVSVIFVNNTDSGGVSPNAIYATTLLPCTFMGLINQTFCWKGWHYYNSSISSPQLMDCPTYINTDVGNMEYISSYEEEGSIKAVPGWMFRMPLVATNNYDRDVINSTMFLLRNNYSNATSYSFGDHASLALPEDIAINLTVETTGQRIWDLQFLVKMQNCPPGFKIFPNDPDKICKCGNNYRGAINCDNKAKMATIVNGVWMGNYSGRYYIALCPGGFCSKQGKTRFTIPDNSDDLNDVVCAKNRRGVICGECKDGYGPSADYPLSDCVICNSTNFAADVSKYFATLYFPLLVFFIVLIFFDIRLTTGPANAFIFYSQAVSTVFGINANGIIPLGQFTRNRTESLVLSYSIPYGFLNLRFIERYFHPICFSKNMNSLDIVLLDYGIAFFPIMVIFLTILLLKLKELCDGHWRIASKYWHRLDKVHNALLPAFATFLLLSYSRVNSISTTLMSTTPLIDENGSDVYPSRLSHAAQYSTQDKHYYKYFVPGAFIFSTFIVVIPLLLLDFPLRFIETIISRSPRLAKFYPSVKIYILVDTFQGCYRKNARFFAGLYFLLRLAVNVAHVYFDTWLGQYIFQQILMTAFIVLIALVKPYKRKFINYIDILIFTDLALINAFSLYFYTHFNTETAVNALSNGLFLVFIIQYILVFLPLLGMLAYILWSLKWSRYIFLKCLLGIAKLCFQPSSQKYQVLYENLMEKNAKENNRT